MSFKRALEPSLQKDQNKYVKNLFKESLFTIIKNFKKGDVSSYEPIISFLKQKPFSPKLFSQWLLQLRDSVPLLDRSTERIVLDTLSIPWHYENEHIESHLQNFVLNLVTSHNYYVTPILECLFQQLKPDINEQNSEALRLNPFNLSKEQQSANFKILFLIKRIAMHVPLCLNIVVKAARNICPYFKQHVHIHVMFTYNLLLLGKLIPSLLRPLLEIIISNLVKLDLHSPKGELENDSEDEDESDNESEDLFAMEVETETANTTSSTSHPIGHCLDMVMFLLFRYIHFVSHGGVNFICLLDDSEKPFEVNGCVAGSVGSCGQSKEPSSGSGCGCRGSKHNDQAIKELYAELRHVFIKLLLPTESTSHAQFLLLYQLSIRPSLVSDFLDMLKNFFERPENSLELRKNAVSYLGSLLTRGNCVKFSHVHYCMEILYNWCKSYLQNEVGDRKSYEDINMHKQFYCACQTLFYVFTFNYKEYTESKGRLRLAQSLHFDELVLSPLNPLRFCSRSTCLNFAAITCHFQLAYCHTILENNCRVFLPVSVQNSYGVYHTQATSLDMSFPFDPYMLKRSCVFILNHYKQFDGIPDEILKNGANFSSSSKEDSNKEENIDVEDDSLFWNSPPSIRFSFEKSSRLKIAKFDC